MVPEIFVDGIGRIGLVEGMIRIEYVSRSELEGEEGGRARTETRQRVIMTPAAFLQSLALQQGVLKKLEEAGLVRAGPRAVDGAEPAQAPARGRGAVSAVAEAPPRSPNFSVE
jgi:hypothetical protein